MTSPKMMEYQYKELIGQLSLLQGHAEDPRCPCTFSAGELNEFCIPKHLLTIAALASESASMEDNKDHKKLLFGIQEEAAQLHEDTKKTIVCKKGPFTPGIEDWARKARKSLEPIYYACGVKTEAKREKAKVADPGHTLTADNVIAHVKFEPNREKVVAAYIGPHRQVLGVNTVATGTAHSAPLPVDKVVREANAHQAKGIVLMHNHPSGTTEISQDDRDATRILREAAGSMWVEHHIQGDTVAKVAEQNGIGGEKMQNYAHIEAAQMLLKLLQEAPWPKMAAEERTKLQAAGYNATESADSKNRALAIAVCEHIISGQTTTAWMRPEKRTLSQDDKVRRYSLLIGAAADLSVASEYAGEGRQDIASESLTGTYRQIAKYLIQVQRHDTKYGPASIREPGAAPTRCRVIHQHDDGDQTLRCKEGTFVKTTDGKIFKQVSEPHKENKMNAVEWLQKYGVPKNWEIAIAIESQIDSYRRAARFLQLSPKEQEDFLNASASYFGKATPEMIKSQIEYSERRVRAPVVDLENIETAGIHDSGGWGNFISIIPKREPNVRDPLLAAVVSKACGLGLCVAEPKK